MLRANTDEANAGAQPMSSAGDGAQPSSGGEGGFSDNPHVFAGFSDAEVTVFDRVDRVDLSSDDDGLANYRQQGPQTGEGSLLQAKEELDEEEKEEVKVEEEEKEEFDSDNCPTPDIGAKPTHAEYDRLMIELISTNMQPFGKGTKSQPSAREIVVDQKYVPWKAGIPPGLKDDLATQTQCTFSWRPARPDPATGRAKPNAPKGKILKISGPVHQLLEARQIVLDAMWQEAFNRRSVQSDVRDEGSAEHFARSRAQPKWNEERKALAQEKMADFSGTKVPWWETRQTARAAVKTAQSYAEGSAYKRPKQEEQGLSPRFTRQDLEDVARQAAFEATAAQRQEASSSGCCAPLWDWGGWPTSQGGKGGKQGGEARSRAQPNWNEARGSRESYSQWLRRRDEEDWLRDEQTRGHSADEEEEDPYWRQQQAKETAHWKAKPQQQEEFSTALNNLRAKNQAKKRAQTSDPSSDEGAQPARPRIFLVAEDARRALNDQRYKFELGRGAAATALVKEEFFDWDTARLARVESKGVARGQEQAGMEQRLGRNRKARKPLGSYSFFLQIPGPQALRLRGYYRPLSPLAS